VQRVTIKFLCLVGHSWQYTVDKQYKRYILFILFKYKEKP